LAFYLFGEISIFTSKEISSIDKVQ